MRLLITASRSWTHTASIRYVIEDAALEAAARGEKLIVVHGAARGGDRIASRVVATLKRRGFDVDEEPHKLTDADWTAPCTSRCPAGHRRRRRDGRDYCPAAGNYRNERMVSARADRAAAFIRDDSAGASHCWRLMKAAHLRPVRIDWDDRHDYPGRDS